MCRVLCARGAGKDVSKKAAEADRLPKHWLKGQGCKDYFRRRIAHAIVEHEGDPGGLQKKVQTLVYHLQHICELTVDELVAQDKVAEGKICSEACAYHQDPAHEHIKKLEEEGRSYQHEINPKQLFVANGQHRDIVVAVLTEWLGRWGTLEACERMASNLTTNLAEAINSLILMFMQKNIFKVAEDGHDFAMYITGAYKNVGTCAFDMLFVEYGLGEDFAAMARECCFADMDVCRARVAFPHNKFHFSFGFICNARNYNTTTRILIIYDLSARFSTFQRVSACSSVFQRVSMCSNTIQRFPAFFSVCQRVSARFNTFQRVST